MNDEIKGGIGTVTLTSLGYTNKKTLHPQRAARLRARELREMAQNIRDFVATGQVEKWKEEQRSQRGKLLSKEGIVSVGMDKHDGQRLIAEAERLELLADLTLEHIGIND